MEAKEPLYTTICQCMVFYGTCHVFTTVPSFPQHHQTQWPAGVVLLCPTPRGGSFAQHGHYIIIMYNYVGRRVWICAIHGLRCANHGSVLCVGNPWIARTCELLDLNQSKKGNITNLYMKKELLRWDSNPRHIYCLQSRCTTEAAQLAGPNQGNTRQGQPV